MAKTNSSKTSRRRTPNAERSARTRQKLLQAAIDCLFEVGYDRTSTVLVTKRAGVSRGSLLHHFPSKADLIMAVSEHIVTLRRAARARALEPLKTPKEKFLALIDVFWNEYSERTGIARIEIMLGSRSDPELGPRYAAQEAELQLAHRAFVAGLLSEMGIRDESKIDAFNELYVAAVRGLAVRSLWSGAKALQPSIDMLKAFQARLLEEMLDQA